MRLRNGFFLLTAPRSLLPKLVTYRKLVIDKNYGKKNKTLSTNDFHRKKSNNLEFPLKNKLCNQTIEKEGKK